jgi:uncharacterized protein YciI
MNPGKERRETFNRDKRRLKYWFAEGAFMNNRRCLTRVITAATICCALAFSSLAYTAHSVSQEPKYEMGTFYLCLLVKRSDAPTGAAVDLQKTQQSHLKYLESLAASGKAVALGPFTDGGRIAGLVVINATSAEEARTLTEADPMVKAGVLAVEVLKWWAAKGIMKPPPTPFNFSELTTYYFGLISRGPKWTAERTPETDKLQAGHMANINAMAKAGKLVIAGPFDNAGNYSGVFVFKVDTLEEARALSDGDPAVQAGRLAVDVHPWMVLKGSLP